MPDMEWSRYDLFLTANLASRTAQQTLTRTKRLFNCGALASEDTFIDFVATQKRLGLSSASTNKFIATTRHYCHFNGLSWVLPKHQKEHSKIRRTFSDTEIINIIDCAHNEYTDILRLLAHTGARPQEILSLTAESYDASTECVVLRGDKTGQDRIIPIAGLRIDWTALPYRCHPATLNNELKRRCAKLHIPYRTCYSFRHSFASRLINGDANLLAVKTLMGHTSVSTTQIYYHTSLTHLRRAMERDTLNIEHMTADQKLALLKKHLAEMVERLKLDTDQSFDVHLDQKTNQISFTVKVKKEKTKSK